MTNMKEVIKKSALMLIVFLATQTYSNVADSIIIKNNENRNIIQIERLKAGSILKIKDEFGMTLHKEKINDSGYYSKGFDLSMLPDATYYFELDNADEIRIIPVLVEDQRTKRLESEESRIAKPNVKVDGQMVYVHQNSDEEQDLFITIYYEGYELAFEESVKDAKNVKRSYDFSSSLKGDYTIIVNTGGKTFSNKVKIAHK